MSLRQRPEVQEVPRGGLTPPADASRAGAAPAAQVVGVVVALTTVAVAQPLLDLLGRNAAFLVAHDMTAGDVVALALGLTIGLPVVMAGVVLLVTRLHRGVGSVLFRAIIGVLIGVLVLFVFRRAGSSVNGVVTLVLAALGGIAGAVLYGRIPALRRMLAVAAIAAPAVAVFFLFATPATSVVLPQASETSSLDLAPDAPPVVVAIFDELPVVSLLGADREIDAANFPSFARLAEDGTFFRNATTVHQQTSDAIPAALTGRYGSPDDLLPLAADHPGNLVELLTPHYDLHVQEPITQLCPPAVCGAGDATTGARYPTLVRDLGVVAGHLFLPADFSDRLPPIDQGWADFRQTAAATGKEAAVAERFDQARALDQGPVFAEFLDGIHAASTPTLHLVHMMLPHSPWRYLPDGRSYTDGTARPGMVNGEWLGDEWRIAHNYQRHLVQTQMVDRLLGDLLDRLDEQGLYDDAVIVVLADHGISFTPGTPLRGFRPETFGEIAAVPLFVKASGQRGGGVLDAPVELVDVLPTIVEAIGGQAPAGLDGHSVLQEASPRQHKTFVTAEDVLRFPAAGEEKWPAVERRARLFSRPGPFGFPYDLAPEGLHELLGRRVPPGRPPFSGAVATVAGSYDDVDLRRDASPLLLQGEVQAAGADVPDTVAVAVNGRVAAVVKVDQDPDAPRAFRGLLPPSVLRRGENSLEIFAVAGDGTLSVLPFEG